MRKFATLMTCLAISAPLYTFASSSSTREGFVICETKEKLNEAYSLLLEATPQQLEKVAEYIELGVCARLEDGLTARFTGASAKPERWGMPAEVSIGGGKFWVLKQSISKKSGKVYLDGDAPRSSTPSIWPVKGWITSGFGFRSSPFSGNREMHSGVDIAALSGSEIIATAAGVVLKSGTNGGYGKEIIIDHRNGITTRYAHNSKNLVKKGQRVKFGQLIAKVGSSGKSTGPHLHYEILVNGKKEDPHSYFRAGVKPPRRAVIIKSKKNKKLPKDRYKKALVLYKAGNDDKAFRLFSESAKLNDRRSQYMLALAYSLGKGVKADSSQALYWFRQSAAQGYADAQYMMGKAYANGDGLVQNQAEALRWFKRAATKGNSNAEYQLWVRFSNGIAVTKDFDAAFSWLKKSATDGNSFAQSDLAQVYIFGKSDIEKDIAKGLEWAKLSAKQGNAAAQYYLGRAYSIGEGMPKDRSEALKWLKLSAEEGNVEGMEFYGRELYLAKRYKDAVVWSGKVAAKSVESSRHLAIAELAIGNERQAHILYNSLAREPRGDKRLLRGAVDDLRRYSDGKGKYSETAKKMLWKYFNVRK